MGSASSHSSRSNHVLGLDHRCDQNQLPRCVTSAGSGGLMLCSCYLEILNNLIFACVLYNSSLMEQWNLCQGLGAWVRVGDSCLSPPPCVPGPKLRHQLPPPSLSATTLSGAWGEWGLPLLGDQWRSPAIVRLKEGGPGHWPATLWRVCGSGQ